MTEDAIRAKIETLNQAVARLQERVEDLEAAIAKNAGKTVDFVGKSQSRTRNRIKPRYRFFFAQAPTRSSAFSMFSIELATLKRK
jgi:hypothetical protein